MSLFFCYALLLINHATSIKIKDEFTYKDQTINEVDIPSHVNFCTKDVMVSFYDQSESKNKYGFINDESNLIHEMNIPVPCEENEKQLIKNKKFEVKIKDHFIDAYYVSQSNDGKIAPRLDINKNLQSSTSSISNQIKNLQFENGFKEIKEFLTGFFNDKNDYCYAVAIILTYWRFQLKQFLRKFFKKLTTINFKQSQQLNQDQESNQIRVVSNKIHQSSPSQIPRVQAMPNYLNNIDQLQYASLLNVSHLPPIQSQLQAQSMFDLPIRDSNPPPYLEKEPCHITVVNETQTENDHCDCNNKCLTKRCPCREQNKGCTTKCHQKTQNKKCENDKDRK